jgi:hypothetical protein
MADYTSKDLVDTTLGIPQRLHEYCEELAYVVAEASWKGTYDQVRKADEQWLKTGLKQSYVTIENQMNDRQTKIGRRNQVLYTLSRYETARFSVSQIETELRKEFPSSTTGKNLGVGTILRELASADDHIIKEAPKISEYEFADPKHRMALRVMLTKDVNTGQVNKRDIN